jgi:uncharacterized membrane protein
MLLLALQCILHQVPFLHTPRYLHDSCIFGSNKGAQKAKKTHEKTAKEKVLPAKSGIRNNLLAFLNIFAAFFWQKEYPNWRETRAFKLSFLQPTVFPVAFPHSHIN